MRADVGGETEGRDRDAPPAWSNKTVMDQLICGNGKLR